MRRRAPCSATKTIAPEDPRENREMEEKPKFEKIAIKNTETSHGSARSENEVQMYWISSHSKAGLAVGNWAMCSNLADCDASGKIQICQT